MHPPASPSAAQPRFDYRADPPPATAPAPAALSSVRHSAYFALLQRGIGAGLTVHELATALAETTGARFADVLADLRSLGKP